MNCFYKAYCRIYQTGFKIALPVLPYRKPKLITGVDNLVYMLKKKHIKSVLIVTDSAIRGFGITKPLEDLLRKNKIHCFVYDKTVANPTDRNVEEARELYISGKCKAIIGVGGGSSMDCAKAVGARIAKPRQSDAQMEGLLKVHKKLPMLIAIPTTAGTGSETSLSTTAKSTAGNSIWKQSSPASSPSVDGVSHS